VEDAADDALPAKMRQQLQHLIELVRDLQRRLAEIDRELGELAREHPAARRLATIPGAGPIMATALVVAIGAIGRFRPGRHLAAYLGLVPQQHASGGKERLGTISKRGNTYVRTLLAHGARAVVRIMRLRPAPDQGWIGRLLQRRPVNVAVMAQANRTARIAWALLTRGEDYRRPTAARAERRHDGMTGRTGVGTPRTAPRASSSRLQSGPDPRIIHQGQRPWADRGRIHVSSSHRSAVARRENPCRAGTVHTRRCGRCRAAGRSARDRRTG
jgi:hypothetical protein